MLVSNGTRVALKSNPPGGTAASSSPAEPTGPAPPPSAPRPGTPPEPEQSPEPEPEVFWVEMLSLMKLKVVNDQEVWKWQPLRGLFRIH